MQPLQRSQSARRALRALHGMLTHTGGFRRGLGLTQRFGLLLADQVCRRLGLVHHIVRCQRPPPTCELQRDAVRVLEVDGAHKRVLVGLSREILIYSRLVKKHMHNKII